MDDLGEPAVPTSHVRTYGGNAAFHNFHNDYSHISDPNLRRRLALSEIDKVPFGWYHVRAVVVAGIGFFTDSYDIFAINLITEMLGMVFWQGEPSAGGNRGELPTSVGTALKAATSGGAVIGQLGFGWLADRVGRRKMYGVELAIIVFATLAQALAAPSQAVTITGLLIWWRVMMGIGIGGDYPLSAIITSEFAPTRWRGAMMAAVFSMQGAGQAVAALVALITTYAFRSALLTTTNESSSCNAVCQLATDRAWRIIVGFGGVPACFALYYRITIPETPRYTFDVAHDIEKADADIKAYIANQAEGHVDPVVQINTKQKIGSDLSKTNPHASWHDVWSYFSTPKNAKILIGTTTSWFFLDLAYYGLGLNNTTVLNAIGYSTGSTMYHKLLHTAIGNLVLVCAGSIPGYWISVLTIDTVGRKPIQILGFFVLTILFCIIGFAYDSLSSGALLALYILAQIFFNFGPNTTTFIVPGECYPTRYRSTGHGLSAASGKIGAIIAQVIASPLLSKGAKPGCQGNACSPWLPHLMQIFALFMLCGTLVSFLIPETKGRTLEEISGERTSSLDAGPQHPPPARSGWKKWLLDPITGGLPAGFHPASKAGPRSPRPFAGLSMNRRQRIGIMTSPELLPKSSTSKSESRLKFKSRKKNRDLESQSQHERSESESGAYTVSVSSSGNPNMEEIYTGGGPFPGWGAGWNVQRHGHANGGNLRSDGRVESILLYDVGKLLK
ncbi:hypothetical protein BP5796_10530 [Coleophoma crateriformis]|uniref:Major facilitator superfamily (MFS) profile domain-containing protein n=1 Tax=Coleophoma crateriformis TaxID=565419 RepID=A0A3D8QQT2_9HELO|nr:hypothetical protein BP5796_10530 [Coleophoma crateriformis]